MNDEKQNENRDEVEEMGVDKQTDLEERIKLFQDEREGLNKKNRDKDSDEVK